MRQDSAFSFACRRCRSCCHHKGIQLNPYEILRLSTALGMGTTRFIARYTDAPGCHLRFTPEGACPFLLETGCRVHTERPLVCRLYPLVRHIASSGETFSLLPLPPQCQATQGREGRVGSYLEEQGAGPFLEAADLYLEVVAEMLNALRRGGYTERLPGLDEISRPGLEKDSALDLGAWLDPDLALERGWRRDWGPAPSDPWGRALAHVRILRDWITTAEQEESDGRKG